MNWYKLAHQTDEWGDFLGEFKWHKEHGIGVSLSDDELKKLWLAAPVVHMDARDLDRVGNTYTPEIYGKEKEERVRQFIEFATTESREDVPESEWSSLRGANPHGYLNRLLEVVGQGMYPPVNLIQVPGVGSLIVGGRTRAAAAKVLDIPLKVRLIKLPPEGGKIKDAVKLLFYDQKEET